MKVERVSEDAQSIWDNFIENVALNATFLHSWRFLSYHGSRFNDQSLMVYDDRKLIAVFPAAHHPLEEGIIVSHPGATFGGIVFGQHCRGERCLSALHVIANYYKDMGIKRLIYKAVPLIFHQTPLQDDLYALFRMQARRIRCDISAVIDSTLRLKISKGRKYEINKAKKMGVEIVEGEDVLGDIYLLIKENLWSAHRANPVHSQVELLDIYQRFPENIRFMAAAVKGEIVAGVIMFNSGRVAHTQYIASNDKGRRMGALDLLIEHCIQDAFNEGFRYFDFGISNEDEGWSLNQGLYRYKRTFGAGSAVHEFYELDLENIHAVE